MQITDGQVTRDLEFCGIEKVDHWQRQIQKMPMIGFEDSEVDGVKDFAQIQKLIPGCESLDLSDTLIDNIEIIQLIEYLPNL